MGAVPIAMVSALLRMLEILEQEEGQEKKTFLLKFQFYLVYLTDAIFKELRNWRNFKKKFKFRGNRFFPLF
jgi:hypothetical protein